MPRQKKDAKILNIKLAKEISDQLEQFCEESGISKTVATEKILSKYFEEYFSRPEEERMLFKQEYLRMPTGLISLWVFLCLNRTCM